MFSCVYFSKWSWRHREEEIELQRRGSCQGGRLCVKLSFCANSLIVISCTQPVVLWTYFCCLLSQRSLDNSCHLAGAHCCRRWLSRRDVFIKMLLCHTKQLFGLGVRLFSSGVITFCVFNGHCCVFGKRCRESNFKRLRKTSVIPWLFIKLELNGGPYSKNKHLFKMQNGIRIPISLNCLTSCAMCNFPPYSDYEIINNT